MKPLLMQFSLVVVALSGGYPAGASLLAPWVGPNVRLGEDPVMLPEGDGQNQAEPHVARSPTDPDLLLATFQEGRFADGGAWTNGYALSLDGGLSWRRALNPRLTKLNGGIYFRATDPVAAIAPDGTLYLNSLVAVDQAFNLGRVVLQRSFDQGQTWSDPISIYTGTSLPIGQVSIFPDKNWMTVNEFPGDHQGRIVVTWTNFRSDGSNFGVIEDALITLSYSDNGGSTWSVPLYVTPPEGESVSRISFQGSQPVFFPDGNLAVVYHNFQSSRLALRYSADGGSSFPFPEVPLHDGYSLYDAPNLRDGAFLPSVSVARGTGDLHVVYVSRDPTDESRGQVYFTRSERLDGGLAGGQQPDWRFREPVRISEDTPAGVVCLPTVAVSPDGLEVTAYYYDNRNDGQANEAGDFYTVQSFDGGATWTDPFRLTEQTFSLDKATSTSRGYMIGDYFGLAAPRGPGQAAVAVWIDTRLESADPWSARIAGASSSVFAGWLQAHLPHAERQTALSLLYYRDHDRDGVPNYIEYLTGQEPYYPDEPPAPAEGLTHALIDPATDPATQVEVTAGTGRWPAEAGPSGLIPDQAPLGEGYWNQTIWPQGGFQNLRFSIEGTGNWYLLEATAPVRWVLDRGQGWVWSSWLGYLYTLEAPWLYHSSLGWIYDLGPVLFCPGLEAYLFLSPAHWPWILNSGGNPLYVLDGGPWVYDPVAENWLQTH